jgi:hypothetical protein
MTFAPYLRMTSSPSAHVLIPMHIRSFGVPQDDNVRRYLGAFAAQSNHKFPTITLADTMTFAQNAG